ncbi:cupin domain-containing protein [Thalassotalea sp. PLHSN55]|uniref:cupin domain-containing protein n=1 Tax=Thalassotalea sp. PLHSN55 TaxID=3435888 RepID=UPI003F871D9E
MSDEMSILRQPQDWLPIAIPGAEGTSLKVYKADEENQRVLIGVKFEPNAKMPRHVHHCTAIAYTLAGTWAYDEGSFEQGDVAYESVGNDHTPWSDEGAELFIVFDSPDGRYIDNYMPDGSILHMGFPFLKALEGLSLTDFSKLDIHSLVDIRQA